MREALAVLVLVASVGVHWPGPEAGFAYDDSDFIVQNASLESPGRALAAFARPFPPSQPERGLYRPLTNLSYAVDHALGGGQARAFHLGNVLLYLAVVLCVHRLARRYLRSQGFALAVALLFSLHPVHCDAVDALAGRSELLALLFGLLSLLAFLRVPEPPARPGHPALWLSAGAYALACLAKETGTVWLAVLLAHRAALRRTPPAAGWARSLAALVPHLAVLAAYTVLRSQVLGRFAPELQVLAGLDPVSRLATLGTVYLADLLLLLFPATLQVDYYYQALIGIVPRLTAAAVLGWLALLGALGLALWLLRRHLRWDPQEPPERVRARAVALCAFAIFFATFFPVSHALPIGALMAERFLFAPSLGFVVLAVLGGRALLARTLPARWRTGVAVALVALLAGAGALRSQARAAEWRDPVALWQAAARALDGDARVHSNLAAALLDRGRTREARAELEAALALEPDLLPALGNLGVLQFQEGRLAEAEATFQRILAGAPDHFLAWHNLGRVAAARGEHAAAAEYQRRALELRPDFAPARAALDALAQEPR